VLSGRRAPRRSQTYQNYQIPEPPRFILHTIRQEPTDEERASISAQKQEEERPDAPKAITKDAQRPQHPPRRPPLGPPRRSYSVTDREPIPHHHRLSSPTGLKLLDLPSELHFAIFDFLDPIDATCLGLTNKHFYAIHRRMNGTVSLSTRRDGPNELEWAWHLSSRISPSMPSPLDGAKSLEEKQGASGSLSQLRVRGQAYCRKCGITRCQLHKHIQEWMGEDMEYCSVKKKFGRTAPEGAKSYCYMSKPGDSSRCGRHWVRKSKVVLQ